jgi:hypothetical protein
MLRAVLVLVLSASVLSGSALAQPAAGAPDARSLRDAVGAPQIPFDGSVDFLQTPADRQFGEVAGVAVNSKGSVFFFSRGNTTGPAYAAAAAQLLEFGRDGTFIREIGKNLYAWSFAHAVRIDRSDNIWAIDKGSDMIIRFNADGRVTMVFGRKKEASDEGTAPWTHVTPPRPAIDGQFRQPTDVAWDSQGNIYITDGYINSRVAKFDKDGDWVKSWGDRGTGAGEFNTPHSIAIDAKDRIYVADRNNRRIQVFDPDGKHLRTITIDVPSPPNARPWYGPVPTAEAPLLQRSGSPWALCITPGPGTQYLYASDAFPGRIYKLTLDGQVLGMLGSSGHQAKQFGWIHEIACPSENELYVAELLNWRVQKLTLHAASGH